MTDRLPAWIAAATVGACMPLLFGCGDDGGSSQLPNPASVFCESRGGTVRIVTAADGSQSGICRLADGTEVDEWEYYRRFHDNS